jgi:exonuclease SbcC
MRPISIKLEGFSAYREAIEVDMSGVEFFSLSGATGSGKSSLVDAMVFALYGRIPRLGAKAVAPAITAGADRARVSFDFGVGGDRYTAVRLAERTKTGASVKEARLQIGEKVIADGANDVTTAVEELLHLRFEDFTRTVVLPQGEFARFLTSDKAERQALLRNLLGLDVYGEVRSLARTRESVARGIAEASQTRLTALEIPDSEVIDVAKTRLSILESLASIVVEKEKTLDALEGDARSLADRVDKTVDAIERLESLEIPDNLGELETLADAASDRLASSDEAIEKARAEFTRVSEEISELPSPDVLRSLRDAHVRLTEVESRLKSLAGTPEQTAVEETKSALAEAKHRVDGAQQALESARVEHAAHALTATIVVGEACPVCDQTVTARPDRVPPSELVELERERSDASVALENAAESAEQARAALTTVETSRAEVEGQRLELVAELEDAPSIDELSQVEAKHRSLSSDLEKAKLHTDELEKQHRVVRSDLETLSESIRSVQRDLMAAQQLVNDLKPPLPVSDDPLVQWKELIEWREQMVVELRGSQAGEIESAAAAVTRAEKARAELVDDLGRAGVPIDEPYAIGVTRELQVARTAVSDAEKTIAETKSLEADIARSSGEADVAAALAGHLRADGFERWMMAGAIAELVAGANDRLSELSGGGYSLDSDETGAFSIIDHHNADEIRSVATLSGGETFLVSLALALSLAETLAARGGADLDAIVIDEGFGSLDEESLDVVASVLEDLSGGLMVGVITHVKELAGRAPVRYEVTRQPTGSKVVTVS